MKQHPEQRENERFLGNHCIKGIFKSDKHEKHLSHLKTFRLGEQAYDIHGNKLPKEFWRPLFINDSEFAEYDKIMTNLLKH